MNDIRYLQHREIDFARWDNTLEKAYNGLVYPYSFFLNAMAGNQWDALVLGDYEAVFPLVWKSKYGIRYLYQPYFCQQLGLFSKTLITEPLISAFMESIPSKFRYINIHLNYNNTYFHPGSRFVNRSSYCVDLNQPYTDIYDAFNADAKKNLAKAVLQGYEYRKIYDTTPAADCFFEAYGMHYPDPETLKKRITACADAAIQLNKGFNRAVYGKNGELWCAGFFFISNKRIHYAMAAPTAEGKKYGATHILIDQVLKEFSAQDLEFDFEGSDIRSVAYFYAKFGSKAKHYLQFISNRLPWWCRFLKER